MIYVAILVAAVALVSFACGAVAGVHAAERRMAEARAEVNRLLADVHQKANAYRENLYWLRRDLLALRQIALETETLNEALEKGKDLINGITTENDRDDC